MRDGKLFDVAPVRREGPEGKACWAYDVELLDRPPVTGIERIGGVVAQCRVFAHGGVAGFLQVNRTQIGHVGKRLAAVVQRDIALTVIRSFAFGYSAYGGFGGGCAVNQQIGAFYLQRVAGQAAQALDVVGAILLVAQAQGGGGLHGHIDASGVEYKCLAAFGFAEVVCHAVHENHIACIDSGADDGFARSVAAKADAIRRFNQFALAFQVFHHRSFGRRNVDLAAIVENKSCFGEEQPLGMLVDIDDALAVLCRGFHITAAQGNHVPGLADGAGNLVHRVHDDAVQTRLHGTCRNTERLHIVCAQSQEDDHDDEEALHYFHYGVALETGELAALQLHQTGQTRALLLIPVEEGGVDVSSVGAESGKSLVIQSVAVVVCVALQGGHSLAPVATPCRRYPRQGVVQNPAE